MLELIVQTIYNCSTLRTSTFSHFALESTTQTQPFMHFMSLEVITVINIMIIVLCNIMLWC